MPISVAEHRSLLEILLRRPQRTSADDRQKNEHDKRAKQRTLPHLQSQVAPRPSPPPAPTHLLLTTVEKILQ